MKKKSLLIMLGMITSLFFLSAQEPEEIKTQKWKIGLSGGIGIRTASFKDVRNELVDAGISKKDADSFYDKVKWVRSLNLETYYLISPEWGVGIKYIYSHASSEKKDVMYRFYQNGYHTGFTDLAIRNHFNFIAPSLYGQAWMDRNQKWKFTAAVSPGYIHFRQEEEIGYETALATANSIALNADIGVEYFINKNWAIAADLSSFNASLGKVKVENDDYSETITLKGNDRVSLARLDLFLGIRFYK